MSFPSVRAPLGRMSFNMEFVFHRELLVQIEEEEIINERKRVRWVGRRKGLLKETEQREETMKETSAS